MGKALVNRHGFTLTELLVVVAIIVLLTAIVVPNITGRLTVARMHAAEDQIAEIESALAAYHADFGTYPGDVFPTEDLNNNGKLDPGEDIGVDINGDGTKDYGCDSSGNPSATPNGRLDRGDGVVNIDDLEWALKTTAKNGPYMDSIPLDPWDQKYVYWAPLTRPTADTDYLYFDPTDTDAPSGSPTGTLITEDVNRNGRLDLVNGQPGTGEDTGIAVYDTTATDVRSGFTSMFAGAGNGILDHGDDDNKDGSITTYIGASSPPARTEEFYLELGNLNISPDGLARNLSYYLYSVGRDGRDDTATGYEDINLNSICNDGSDANHLLVTNDAADFDEDINGSGTLDTGYEDTGDDGIPGTKDNSEGDGSLGPDEDFTGSYNANGSLDTGGDDINSWNKSKPWRSHDSYGG